MLINHPTGRQPHTVNLVCLGPTMQTYHTLNNEYTPRVPPADEIWTLNKGLRSVRADMVWIMDDLIGELRKSARYGEDIRALLAEGIPVITSTVDGDVCREFDVGMTGRCIRPYPYNEVLAIVGAHVLANKLGRDGKKFAALTLGEYRATCDIVGHYFHNSVPYILAYALAIGVRKLNIFGADYTFPGFDRGEDGRANVEYWCGILRSCGVEIMTTDDTTLLDMRGGQWLYGYGARPPVREMPTHELMRDAFAEARPALEVEVRSDD